jgi:antitoxin component YwqK of YwqJK toxin-antitoxin module
VEKIQRIKKRLRNMKGKNVKCYPNGKKRKEVTKMIKNGNDFRLITNYDASGNILSVMEKPNLKDMNPIYPSFWSSCIC